MLASLEIKNYAIIEHAHIEFGKGLNIITGETGAGKSILLGALGLTLGERADSKSFFNPGEKCVVEASFDISAYQLHDFFKENDIDFESHTILRREIAPNGKTRAFINDTPVTLETLKLLAAQLVNLHSQNETHELNNSGFQLNLIDYVAGNESLLTDYKKIFSSWKKSKMQLETLLQQQQSAQQEYDYHAFLLKEIEDAQLDGLILEEMEEELTTLSNAETIKSKLMLLAQAIENDEYSALSVLNRVYSEVRDLSRLGKTYEVITERINSAIIELEDLKSEAENLAENTELDEERIQQLEDKVNTANKLLKKHALSSIESLMQLRDELKEKTLSLENIEGSIEKLRKESENLHKEALQLAQKISDSRKKALPLAEEKIMKTLHQVGMPSAIFKVSTTTRNDLSESGLDEVEFLFSSNKGFEPQSLKKIASGGELSRVMLSIKSLLASSMALPTLIFDEIDTGISGEVAARVGEVFRQMSSHHQIISITHLPQIAAKAEKHFFIYKKEKDGKTQTRIETLNANQHIEAVARMLSGEKITEASLSNARQLIAS
jgi:DNA repair protein RecN (Recombination protein N)